MKTLEDKGALGIFDHRRRDGVRSGAAAISRADVGLRDGRIFRDNGMHALIIYDDLSKQAVCVSPDVVAAAPPAGPRRFIRATSSICTHVCSKRAAKLNEDNKSGSLTALPIIETKGQRRFRPTSRRT